MATRAIAGLFLLVASTIAGPVAPVGTPAPNPSNIGQISPLGTLGNPPLPAFLPGGPEPNGFPWGSIKANSSDDYSTAPNTGVTRRYNWTLTAETIAPDGVERPGMLINGVFPGPTLEANWGDWIEVTVNNALYEGTSIHWHGLLQKASPSMDGVPGIQQCPLAPGTSFTYRFRADLWGTSWYHTHYDAQYTDGVFGPMVIYGPHDNIAYDEDIGPILVNDWFHTGYETLIEQVMAPAASRELPPFSNNVLINGKMNYPCQNATAGQKCTPNAGIAKFQFQSGKKYRLRVMNTGAEGMQKFSIDGHQLTVIANDFVPMDPYVVDVVTLGVGQRTDVVVEAIGKPGEAYWMRSELGPSAFAGGCSLPDGVSPTGLAAIYYENADTSIEPTSSSSVTYAQLTSCENDPLEETTPLFPMAPTLNPDLTVRIDITFGSNGTHDLFYMNNSSFRADYNDPILLETKLGKRTFGSQSNVIDTGNANSVRLVLYNHAQTGAHPMHLHGHNMYVLAKGSGTWDGTIVNAHNPLRRDVFLLPNAVSPTEPSYIVIQYDADNAGAWPFHCHIAWHVSAGLYVNLLERPDEIQYQMDIPRSQAQTCRDWAAWTGGHVVDEIDSGL